MKLINQYHEIIRIQPFATTMIEMAGRTCYKSEEQITVDSAKKFVKMIVKRGHMSVIEHVHATVKFVTNRGVTHELVRHRLASYSQESTRYVNYGGQHIQFITPVWYEPTQDVNQASAQNKFIESCERAELYYNQLLKLGWRPEQAREVLPNALKTEIVVTANFREWLHIFELRTSKAAHPQIRELMIACQKEFIDICPAVFDN